MKKSFLIKKMLERNWYWYSGSAVQKERHIKTLERIIAEQEKRLNMLEGFIGALK